ARSVLAGDTRAAIGRTLRALNVNGFVVVGLLLTVATALAQEPGPDWVKVTDKAPWQPRDSSGEVVFKDRMWILGGWFDSYHAPPRDVWSSPDGKDWQLVAKQAPWIHSDLPMTLVFKDRMW